jgi:hypothetical protein
MNPFTPLPSFYEMMLIEEAHKSGYRALKDGLESLARQAARLRSYSATGSFASFKDRLLHFIVFMVKKYSPEIRLVITYYLERKCVLSSSATLSESLYGGKRARVSRENRLRPLTRPDQTRLVLLMVLSWYVDEKLEAMYQRWKSLDASRLTMLKQFFLKLYPYLCLTKHGSIFMYQLLYLTGKTVYFHPCSHLLGTIVRRVTQEDVSQEVKTVSNTSRNQQSELRRWWAPYIRQAVWWGTSVTIILGWIYRLQEYLEEQRRQQQGTDLIPPPPEAPALRVNPNERIRVPQSDSVCPLCQQPWLGPTASTSGNVFCHKCVILYVREHKKCPLTGQKCLEGDVVRIYEPQQSTARQ